MDGILSDGRKGKLFFCRRHDGHVLGLHVNVSIAGGFIDRLLLFREAVTVENLSQARVKTKLDGTSHEIEGGICGTKRTWRNKTTAVNLLGTLYGKEKV